ncbi:MAG TPA: P-type conjugative transfer protein TrbL, partial [Noviherbaspirillum sp.]
TTWLLMLASLVLVASPAFATGEYDLGSIMTQYQTAATQFGQNITSIALKLTYTLFTLDICWLAASRTLKNADAVEIGTAVIMRLMWASLVIWLINNPSVPLAFVNSFIQIGKTGAGTTAISPSDVFWQGVDMVNLMMTKFSDNSTIAGVPVPAGISAMSNPFAAILIGMALIVIIVCYSLLAAQFAVAWVQLWFYLAVYPIVLAFGTLKFTRDMAMKVITTPIVYGVRFMAIYFIIAVGTTLASAFGTEIGNLSLTNLAPIWTVLAGSVLLLMLTLKVPTLASDLLGGTASLSAGDGVGAGLVAGGAIGAVAGGAYALGTGAANGVAGAIKAGQSAIAQAREKGATGMMATTAGAVGAIGSAVGEAAMEGIKGLGAESAGGKLANRMDAKTASIREAKAAGSPAESVPGGQPPAPESPAAAAGQVSLAPDNAQGETPPAPTRDTPPAPAAPATTSQAAAVPVFPAAPATPSADAPKGSDSAPTAPSAPVPGSASDSVSDTPPTGSTPTASSKAAGAAKQVLSEMEKSGGAAGGSIQTHHGDE